MKPSAQNARNYSALLSGALLCGVLVLAGCAAPAPKASPDSMVSLGAPPVVENTPIAYTSCVPYARSASGVKLFGDAWTWWKEADGKYAKGAKPEKGSVLTLQKTKALPLGHVAVVAALTDDPRKIMVDHANWGDNHDTRGKIHMRQPVIDVSKNNDWSEVRFMNTVGTFGRVYASHGFIYADPPKLPADTRTALNNKS
ncbi:MAG TPA: CHAP domain-containing protein [Alphaproteobacteria bacterium]|jgi:surface antigen